MKDGLWSKAETICSQFYTHQETQGKNWKHFHSPSLLFPPLSFPHSPSSMAKGENIKNYIFLQYLANGDSFSDYQLPVHGNIHMILCSNATVGDNVLRRKIILTSSYYLWRMRGVENNSRESQRIISKKKFIY